MIRINVTFFVLSFFSMSLLAANGDIPQSPAGERFRAEILDKDWKKEASEKTWFRGLESYNFPFSYFIITDNEKPYKVSLDFANFPLNPPSIKIDPPIYHWNVNQDSGVLITPLYTAEEWAPTKKAIDVIEKLHNFLVKREDIPLSPSGHKDIYNLFNNFPEKFRKQYWASYSRHWEATAKTPYVGDDIQKIQSAIKTYISQLLVNIDQLNDSKEKDRALHDLKSIKRSVEMTTHPARGREQDLILDDLRYLKEGIMNFQKSNGSFRVGQKTLNDAYLNFFLQELDIFIIVLTKQLQDYRDELKKIRTSINKYAYQLLVNIKQLNNSYEEKTAMKGLKEIGESVQNFALASANPRFTYRKDILLDILRDLQKKVIEFNELHGYYDVDQKTLSETNVIFFLQGLNVFINFLTGSNNEMDEVAELKNF